MTIDFWNDIPEDCKKAISELKRLKVFKLLALDYEETFSDVWWLVLHEVDMYVEGEFCREASRSYYGVAEPDAMDKMQAKRADTWLVKWLPLFNKYTAKEYHTDYYYTIHSGWGEDDYVYNGQLLSDKEFCEIANKYWNGTLFDLPQY